MKPCAKVRFGKKITNKNIVRKFFKRQNLHFQPKISTIILNIPTELKFYPFAFFRFYSLSHNIQSEIKS